MTGGRVLTDAPAGLGMPVSVAAMAVGPAIIMAAAVAAVINVPFSTTTTAAYLLL